MNGNTDSRSSNVLSPTEKKSPENGNCSLGKVLEMEDDEIYSRQEESLSDRVRKEVKSRLGELGDEILDEVFDEDDSAEVKILEEEEVVRGTRGVGPLWKISLCAFVSFATYILLSGPSIEPNWIPNITERDPIPKIYRPRNGKHSSSSS